MWKRILGSAVVLGSLASAVPVLAESDRTLMMERGEGMMQMMMGSDHEDFDRDLEARQGKDYVDRMHETLGRMGAQGMSSGVGMMPMMRMMGGSYGMSGYGSGYHSFLAWLWVIVWTVNSVLVGLALWTYVKKHSGK